MDLQTSGMVVGRLSLHAFVAHIKNAYRKLDVHNGRAAVMRALQLGLVQSS